MNVKTTLVTLLLTFSGLSMAGDAEHRWNNFSEKKKEAIAAKALAAGYDITTEEGKAAFKEAMKEQRIERAAELGFDITTEEGRQAFREARKEHRETLKQNLSELSDEERAELREQLSGLSRQERREYLRTHFGS